MKTQPILGMDRRKTPTYYVAPTYCATLCCGMQAEQNRCLYLLVVFPKRPVESDDPCLFISSEVSDEGPHNVLGVFDEASHRILQNEKGDWTDITSFKRRALELASERCATSFVESERGKWKYKSVSDMTNESLNGLISQGWSVVNSSMGSDGNEWFLLKHPR